MSDLRDHSQPCEHGQTETHQYGDRLISGNTCPGGRQVTIDYEALIGEAAAKTVRFHDLHEAVAFLIASETIGLVAAAIGDAG